MRSSRWSLRTAAALGLVVAGTFTIQGPAQAASRGSDASGGYVYTSTNDPSGNKILIYARNAANGVLTFQGSVPTGGTGTADRGSGPLGSPGGGQLGPPDADQSLLITPNHKFLLAVNERSDNISVFRIEGGALSLVELAPSRGNMPVSLGQSGHNIYVVNKDNDPVEGSTPGQTPNYRGFSLSTDGQLTPLPAANESAPEGSSPTQALITPFGDHLFSSDFFAHQLRSFLIPPDGRLTEAQGSPQPTQDYPRPPAEAFPPGNIDVGLGAHPTLPLIYVGQAANGLTAEKAQQVAVYRYDRQGRLKFIQAVPESGVAACWFRVSSDGRWLYAANTFDSSVSVLSLANPTKPVEVSHTHVDPAGGPNQFTVSPDGRYLIVSSTDEFSGDDAGNALHVLRINPNGSLTEVQTVHTGATGPLGVAAFS